PRSVALPQLRFTSLAVVNLPRDLHPQECAHAGRTKNAARGRRNTSGHEVFRHGPLQLAPKSDVHGIVWSMRSAGGMFKAGGVAENFSGGGYIDLTTRKT
ncbi:hypothetical protein, partial [Candidatus Burkholderia verschuerenii]|uniref:hypothetical protein n=1 Tax=Candidatus Burkholderia verschuerenii TaxID=242163 RepID=UPI001E523AA2